MIDNQETKIGLESLDELVSSLEETDMKDPSVNQLKHKSKVKLLLVEDDYFHRLFFEKFLSESSYHVTSVDSGEEALRLLESKKFDLIISDIKMPNMSGYSFLEKVLSSSKFSQVPIIMLTGSPKNQNEELEIVMGGADMYCNKSNHKQLLSQIEFLLS